MDIEQAGLPRALEPHHLHVRAGPAHGAGPTGWPGRARVVGYIGLMFVEDEAHVTTIAVAPDLPAPRVWARVLMLDAARISLGHGAGTCPWRWRPATSGPRPSTAASASPRSGVRKGYYPITGEDAFVMWAYDIDTPGLRRAAGRHRGPATLRRRDGADRPMVTSAVLGIETSCDETAAAVVAAAGSSARRWSRARSTCTPATAGSSPSWPGGPTSSCSTQVVDEALAGAGIDRAGPRIDAVAATCGPGPDRLAPGRAERGQGPGHEPGTCPSSG